MNCGQILMRNRSEEPCTSTSSVRADWAEPLLIHRERVIHAQQKTLTSASIKRTRQEFGDRSRDLARVEAASGGTMDVFAKARMPAFTRGEGDVESNHSAIRSPRKGTSQRFQSRLGSRVRPEPREWVVGGKARDGNHPSGGTLHQGSLQLGEVEGRNGIGLEHHAIEC